jgi:glycosyltransferase involved in cell wall biosynthesis
VRISVIICTYNPRKDYLERTLVSLKNQTLEKTQWELVLLDNGSTQPLADEWDLSWHPHGKHVREDALGLTNARIRGIKETNLEIIVFVDDDNVLDPQYLEEVWNIFDGQPQLGCIGAGVLKPEFETEPLPETWPYLSYLALRELDRDVWGNQLCDWIPWGAGLSVRRQVAELFNQFIQSRHQGTDLGRKGGGLMSGEDDIFSHVAIKHNWGIGLFVSLKIVHLIAERRLTHEYLERLIDANGMTRAFLASLHGEDLVNPFRPTSVRQLLTLLGNASLRHLLKQTLNYFSHLSESQYDRGMASLQFDGWERGRRLLSEMKSAPI